LLGLRGPVQRLLNLGGDAVKLRVLDQENISFKISGDIIEVYDQDENLVGDRPFKAPVKEGMTIDEVYAVSSKSGYDINTLIQEILEEAVYDNHDYNVWLQEEKLAFYSPGLKEWVLEPYEGLFAWIKETLTTTASLLAGFKIIAERDESASAQAEEPAASVEAEEPAAPAEAEEPVAPALEDEDVFDVDTFDQHIQEDDLAILKKRLFSPSIPPGFSKKACPKPPEDSPADRCPQEVKRDLQEKNFRLHLWENSFRIVCTSRARVEGITPLVLAERVALIVSRKNQDIFDIDEKELLFELAVHSHVLIMPLTVIEAGLHMALHAPGEYGEDEYTPF